MITLELPWPPSDNHYWPIVNGRKVLGSEGKKFRSRVVETVRALRIACKISDEPMRGRIGVLVELYPPAKPKRRRDIFNYMKALLDSLTHARVYVDDEQIDDGRPVRCQSCDGGKVIVTIWELPGEQ